MKYDIVTLDRAINLLLPEIEAAKYKGVSFDRPTLLNMVSRDYFVKSLDQEWNPSYDERVAYFVCQEAVLDLKTLGYFDFGQRNFKFTK